MSRRAPVQLACGRSTSGQYEILQDTTDRVLRSNVGNIYRFLEKVTPQVQLFSDEEEPYYRLIDLWDALNEPYGFEVPLKVCETYKEEEVDAFYTPHLSGLQIYLPAQSESITTEGQKLFFEWYSSDPPDSRLPIMDQIESIAHECPLINDPETRSSKLGSNSWISIMWLPILCHNLTANRVRGQFLTYHLLRPPPNKVHQFWSSTFTFASATPIEGNTVATQTPETKANSASTQTDIKGRLRTPSDGGRSHSVPPPERSQLESFLPQKKEDHSDASDPKLNEQGSKPSSTASSPLQPTYLRAIDQPFLSVEKVPSNYSKSNGSHSPYSVSSDPNMLTFDNYDTPSVSPFMSDDGSHASSPVMSASCSPTNPPVIDSTRKGYVVLVGFIPYKIRFDTWFSHMPLLEGMELYQAPLWLMDASNKLIKSAKCQHPDFYHFLTNMPVLNRLLEEFQK